MTTRWARFARGWIAALISTFVAACSHALAGGGLPGTAGLALCLAFSGVVSILLAGKTLSLWRLSLAVALSQLLFHSLFSLLTVARPGGVPTGDAVGVGMNHGGEPMVLQPGPAASAVPPMSLAADLRMWAGHAIAAVVTIAVLALGEHVFWCLADGARLCVTRILGSVLPVDTPAAFRARLVAGAIAPRPRYLVFSIHRHRGPPVFATAL
jgi:hypothetical protein